MEFKVEIRYLFIDLKQSENTITRNKLFKARNLFQADHIMSNYAFG